MNIQKETIEKVVLLDFCETVVKFQTADRFVYFVCNKIKNPRIKFLSLIHKFLLKLRIIQIIERYYPHFSLNKRFILLRLKGIKYEILDKFAKEYYNDEIRSNLIYETVSTVRYYQSIGYKIILLSGGYDLYLKYFANEFNIKDVICTKISFKKNKCIGNFDGLDCLSYNKILLLEQYLNEKLIKIDKELSIALSDSITDLPMFSFVGKSIVVHRKGRIEWFKQFNYNNIITWEN